MAKVSKRSWIWGGVRKTAFLLTYADAKGKRHRKQFDKKADAEAERIRVEGQLASGVHVPDKSSITVSDAARAFLADFQGLVDAGKRERSSLTAYQQQVTLHLEPQPIASMRLSRLGGPDCVAYARWLEANLSDAMSTRVFALLRQILKFSQANGWIATNPSLAVLIRTAGERSDEEDGEVEIPPKEQIRALFLAAKTFDDTGYADAVISLLAFGGLRASEMRGLPRRGFHHNEGKVSIFQRADRWNVIGPCKTKNSKRKIPLPPFAVQAVRRWLIKAPPSESGLIFPNGAGNVESYANIYNRFWAPLMHWAGLADVLYENGKKVVRPWFALHTLRHVACSLWIEQDATPKRVQSWAGHASIQFTMDRYGHLWDNEENDQAVARAIERSLLG